MKDRYVVYRAILQSMPDVKRRAFEFAVRDGERHLAQKVWDGAVVRYWNNEAARPSEERRAA